MVPPDHALPDRTDEKNRAVSSPAPGTHPQLFPGTKADFQRRGGGAEQQGQSNYEKIVTAFALTACSNWSSITHLANYLSQNRPTISSDESLFIGGAVQYWLSLESPSGPSRCSKSSYDSWTNVDSNAMCRLGFHGSSARNPELPRRGSPSDGRALQCLSQGPIRFPAFRP